MDDLRQHRDQYSFHDGANGCDLPGSGEADALSELLRVATPTLWHGDLARIVEAEIIPRMMLALRDDPFPEPARRATPTPEEIASFADLMLAPGRDDAEPRVAGMMAAGLSLESLLLDLLAPTARHLGVLWEEDLCDFTELTIAMGRLQRITHDLRLRFDEPVRVSRGRSVLLATCPGETHCFGLSLLERFFHDAGWDVTCLTQADGPDALRRVRREWFDIVGLSLGSETLLPVLAETVSELRQTSRNPDLHIMVGGPIFVDNPGHLVRVGADATASDARDAIAIAERLLDLHARAC
ncbi:cobalamin B12-binding domain-containing protein [Methylobacterium sp. Leaf108]|uniref:cobalamin B12-binding domain-containing protein n=1 Tax=Methylobacterium sp. Leaf108 TaxID=1736256 RepID=UPI000A593470|nr:cobalamin B12-binding domain-containing protein [Methylobacterium sp. Leaf108]